MITLINSNNSNYKSPQYQIQIGSTDQQIYTIAARTFNSDKSFWRKVAIFFGSERKFIPIKIGNNTIETVYVKIQDIQKNLGIKPQEISKVENFDEYNFNELIKNKYSEKHRVSADKSFANSAKIQRQISSSPKQIVTPKKKQSTNSAKTQVKGLPQKFKNRLKELQFKEIDEQNLIHAGKRINFSAMINLLEKEKSPEKKQRLMNTFIAIGKTIEIADNSFGDKGLRVKRDKLNDTHAFTIIDNRVFIELSKLNINDKSVLLGKGAFKSVTKAYEIIKDSRQKPKLVARVVTTEDDGELENREKVSRAKNVVKAHICRVFSSSKKSKDIIKTVTFEQLYTTGDALLNIKMPLKDKISALIGVGTGIAEIHKLGYVHMDIKIDNCLLERRKNGYDGNIADLGMLQQKK